MKIPTPVIAVVSDLLATRYTHSRIDYFMEAAGLEGDPPMGNKVDKTRSWLKRANSDDYPDALAILGKVITELMEVDTVGYASEVDLTEQRAKVQKVLGEHGLTYVKGGRVVPTEVTPVSKTIEELIRAHDCRGYRWSSRESTPMWNLTQRQQLRPPVLCWNRCSKSTSPKKS